jgi:hypothetical protein
VILALMMVPGCGHPDVDVLAADSVAFLYDVNGSTVNVNPAQVKRGEAPGLRTVALPTGTRVLVLEDARAAEDPMPDLRPVKVRISEGDHIGKVGLVSRYMLRPGN